MPVITDLIQLSRFAGERFDLVQANGGNASMITEDGTMWIKASGTALSDVSSVDDLCEVNLEGPLNFLAAQSENPMDHGSHDIDREAVDCLIASSKDPKKLPSNETFLHAMLGPMTLHTTPPVVTNIVCQRGWKEKLAHQFPNAIFVDYATPGARLAVKLEAVLSERNWHPGQRSIIFLENHGLIVTGANAAEVAGTTDEVVAKLSYFLGVELSRYRLSNRISDLILATTGELVCSYLCEDKVLLDAVRKQPSVLLAQPVFPEQVAYAGPAGLELVSLDDEKPLQNYIERYDQLPRVILYRASMSQLFIVADKMKRCREIEQVLKAHVLTLLNATMPQVHFLSDEELIYLMNWETEKYRQKV